MEQGFKAATPTALMTHLRDRQRPLKHPDEGGRKEGTYNSLYGGLSQSHDAPSLRPPGAFLFPCVPTK